jgi:O-acetyl-ADP-ribose deacetylase (regulator of RNase III)
LKENNLRSIAFPCISTGVFGYDKEKAANVALKTVYNDLNSDSSKGLDKVKD